MVGELKPQTRWEKWLRPGRILLDDLRMTPGGNKLEEGIEAYNKEQVEAAMYNLVQAAEEDDMPRVLSFVSQTASGILHDADRYMPLIEIDKARILGDPKITLEKSAEPLSAVVALSAHKSEWGAEDATAHCPA